MVRDTFNLKSELEEAAIHAKIREKKVTADGRARAESRGREGVRWALGEKKVGTGWA